MLYDRWCQTVAARREEWALCDRASGRAWTFAALRAAGEARVAGEGPLVFPQGQTPEFILDLLAAWRQGRVVCPLEAGETPSPVPVPPAPCVHLKRTSATGGAPRWVAFTAAQLAADADNLLATMALRPEWPNLGVISLAHSYGFSNLVLPLLLHGIPLILEPSPLPERVRQAAGEFPAVTLPAVPALWRAWHEAAVLPARVRLALSAGAPLPLALEQAILERTGLKVHNFYGASECGGIAYDASAGPRADTTAVGQPVRNVTLSVAADGCLEVRGGTVGQTYWPEPAPALGAGCFRTTDLAELRDGQVFLRGRAGDVINVAGRKVSPEAIEQALLGHPLVAECLVFGVPNPALGRGEEIVAVLVGRPGMKLAEVRGYVGTRLPPWQVPRAWWEVASLEINPRGKPSRVHWRERYLQRRSRAGGEGRPPAAG